MAALKEYLKVKGWTGRGMCPACALPKEVVTEIVEARKQPVPIPWKMLRDYLRDKHEVHIGHDALRRHFNEHESLAPAPNKGRK